MLLVASTDLSHFHTYDKAKALDQVVLDQVAALDPKELHQSVAASRCEACGAGPMVTAMLVARKLGATAGKVLNYANSGDVTGDRSRVVGYMAAALVAGPAVSKTPPTAAATETVRSPGGAAGSDSDGNCGGRSQSRDGSGLDCR